MELTRRTTRRTSLFLGDSVPLAGLTLRATARDPHVALIAVITEILRTTCDAVRGKQLRQPIDDTNSPLADILAAATVHPEREEGATRAPETWNPP